MFLSDLIDCRCGNFYVNDIIISIDDVAVDNLHLDEVKRLTIGPEGSHCVVTVLRARRRFEIVCERLAASSITR